MSENKPRSEFRRFGDYPSRAGIVFLIWDGIHSRFATNILLFVIALLLALQTLHKAPSPTITDINLQSIGGRDLNESSKTFRNPSVPVHIVD